MADDIDHDAVFEAFCKRELVVDEEAKRSWREHYDRALRGAESIAVNAGPCECGSSETVCSVDDGNRLKPIVDCAVCGKLLAYG